MAVLKQTTSRARPAEGGFFDLGDLRAGAEEALRAAREEAARIVADATSEARRLHAEARAAGFAEGRAAGHADGLAAGRAEGEAAGREAAFAEHDGALRVLETAFAEELARWSARREESIREAESGLAAIAVAIAERVVAEHVVADPGRTSREAAAAVALFAGATRLAIEVAPEDVALVRKALPALAASLADGAEIMIAPAAGMARGGCLVRSGEGVVDARLETKFRRIRESLLGTGAGTHSASEAATTSAETPAPAPGSSAIGPSRAAPDAPAGGST